ncbi:MAG: hypothetical protein ABIL37_00385 [candidate division WOR-3 bacterium]
MKDRKNEIHAIDVIQSIQTTRVPLTIIVVSEGNRVEKVGKIYVNDKKIYHAEYENYIGIEALKRIIKLPIKRVYILRTETPINEKTIDLKADEVLLNVTFLSQNLPSFTTFISVDGIVNELRKVGSVICILFYFETQKSEVIDFEYIDPSFFSKKLEISDKVSDFIKKYGSLIGTNDTLILEREIVYIVHKTLNTYLAIVGKGDIQVDLVRIIIKKMI